MVLKVNEKAKISIDKIIIKFLLDNIKLKKAKSGFIFSFKEKILILYIPSKKRLKK